MHKECGWLQRRARAPLAARCRAGALACALFLAAFSAPVAGASSAAPPPAEDFFRYPEVVDEILSPDGKYLALLGSGHDGRLALVVCDTRKPAELHHVASYNNADVIRVHWVNSRRLVYSVMDLQQDLQTGNGGLFAVDWDGSDQTELIAPDYRFRQEQTGSNIVSHVLPSSYLFYSTLPGEGDEVMVTEAQWMPADRYNIDQLNLVRLNTRNRERTVVLDAPPPHVTQWYLDHDGEPRIGIATREGVRRVYVHNKGDTQWTEIEHGGQFDGGLLQPLDFDFDGGLFAVRSRSGAVYRIDMKTPTAQGKLVLSLDGFDFVGGWEVDTQARKVLGVHFLTDAPGTRWLDPYMAAAQKAVDAALPATVNSISCGHCLSSRYLLVKSESDRQPPVYYLFDPQQGKVTAGVGSSRPWIKPTAMGLRDFVTYTAHDGMKIPAYINYPPDWHKGDRKPLIVLVHGGPYVSRSVRWVWDAEAQFLATRGYVVIQPEFRGSGGFGYTHFAAGWHQWGLAMQDDLTDAARWAIAQGYADPARVAIGGASYGGYATIMGLIKEPALFRCGFEFAGVTDLETMTDFAWSDASEDYRKYGKAVLIGDAVKDKDLLVAGSPIHQAERLKQPLLMAQGRDDARVPIIQGTTFRDALTRTNKNVEWIEYAGEGHGFRKDKDQIDYWRRVENFLNRNLVSGAPGAPPSRASAP